MDSLSNFEVTIILICIGLVLATVTGISIYFIIKLYVLRRRCARIHNLMIEVVNIVTEVIRRKAVGDIHRNSSDDPFDLLIAKATLVMEIIVG